MTINELKAMNETERILWIANAKAKDLGLVLKNEGVKGISKMKKAEKLAIIVNLVVENNVTDEDVKKIIEDTKQLIEEINVRQCCEENIEETLYARYKNKEITYNELRKTCNAYNIDIPLSCNEENSIELIDRFCDLYSNYEHYVDADNIYYSVLDKDFEWDNVFRNNGKYIYYNWEEQQLYERNTVDKDGLQLAFTLDYNENYILSVYKNYELLATYADGDIDNIKRLIAYDDKLVDEDLDTYTELLELLDKQLEEYNKIINEHWEKERKVRQERETREKKYKEAYDRWTRFYQPYVYGKYKFEDIWNNAGEIKNYNLWNEMEKLAKQERDKREQEYRQQYSDLFGNNTGMVVKEEDKDVYKRIYRIASLKLHPDVAKDNGRAMTILNKLKEQWGI